MQFCKLKQDLILPLLFTLITITILSFPLSQDRYAHSQSSIPNSTANATGSGVDLINTNSTANATGSGVDLLNTHPSPTNVKAGSNFEILSTVVNNSPGTILLPAGRCDSPLTAFFKSYNVVIRHTQGLHRDITPIRVKSRTRGYSSRSSFGYDISSNQGWKNSSYCHCLLPNRERAAG